MNKGMWYVTTCYILWGILPVYWKMLKAVDSVYILCSRVFWSMIFISLIILLMKKGHLIKEALKDKRSLIFSALSGIVICINWGVYIWAVNHNHIVDSSLGYYLNPLLVIGISTLLFHEKISRGQWLAIIVSACGVFVAIVSTHTVPLIALLIGGSFAVYGALKKMVAYESGISMFFETLFVSPAAIICILFCELQGKGAGVALSGWSYLLLPLAGVVTAVPLLFFAAGVKKVPYYFTGILMYVNPTLQLLVGVLLYREKFTLINGIVFALIWIGVLSMMAETFKKSKIRIITNS